MIQNMTGGTTNNVDWVDVNAENGFTWDNNVQYFNKFQLARAGNIILCRGEIILNTGYSGCTITLPDKFKGKIAGDSLSCDLPNGDIYVLVRDDLVLHFDTYTNANHRTLKLCLNWDARS